MSYKVYRRTHPEELSVVVARIVVLGIVHELNLGQIHAVVVGLQNLLELKKNVEKSIILWIVFFI